MFLEDKSVPDSVFDCLLPAWSSLESTLCFSLRFICSCSRAAQKLAAAFVNYFYALIFTCFFQVSLPENQRDLFRLVWFRNSDIDDGYIQLFQFTRHVWGINSSPYIALFAIQRLISENPTDAGELTLTAIETIGIWMTSCCLLIHFMTCTPCLVNQ